MNFRTTKKLVNINEIKPNPWNCNVQSKEMFDKEVQSIKELGMIGSILVRETCGYYEIIDGEHRYKACLELGYVELPVETIGEIPDNEAKTLTILLNNLRGKDDIEKRARIFQQLEQGQLQLLPFTDEQIKNEKQLVEWSFDQYQKKTDIKKRVPTRTVAIGLTDDEWKVWEQCLEFAHKRNWTDLQLFLFMVNDFLALNGKAEPMKIEAVIGTDIKF